MFPANAPVLALVSGGGDSVALLRLLASGALGETGALSVLHVNHLLRGAESDTDEAFVRGLCAELGVGLTVARADVAEYARAEALNLEDAGRRVRYRLAGEALDAACDALGVSRDAGRIVTAHSRDDRAETFMMRAIKGAGSGGLASVPYVRGRVVRPLLDCDRAAIRAALQTAGHPWREDASNADTDRLRALVRAELVPVCERVNPAFRETLARSLDLLAAEDAFLAEAARESLAKHAAIAPGVSAAFDRTGVAALPLALARRVLREGVREAFPDLPPPDASHTEVLLRGMASERFAHDLPGGLRARGEYARMVVSRAGEAPAAVAPSLLPIPAIADLGPAGRIRAELVGIDDLTGTPESVVVDLGVPPRTLLVDSVRPGDRMRPLGMTGSRKLSDLLVDAKIPRRERPGTPVVRDGERIVWLAGVRMSEEYRVGPHTRTAVRLTWDR